MELLEEEFQKAWEIRKQNFDAEIHFFAPTLKRYQTDEFTNSSTPFFVPVSITGATCKLNCKHCSGRLLESMYWVKNPEKLFELGAKLYERGCKGMLITGGSLASGVVPLKQYASTIKELKEKFNFRIAVHTGLVDEELAYKLSKANIDIAMIDIIGCNETIHEICHLNATAQNFKNSLELLTKYKIRVAPHVVLGLHYGQILGELQALELISAYDIACLVLVILSPLLGTPMESVVPPSALEACKVFLQARRMFAKTPMLLGCARPTGQHKTQTDIYAVKAGFNGIAYPADGIINFAKKLGLKPKFSEYCCSLIFM
ncbi:MAG TPA: radical SAM protein [bacterium (Candidatus Stahlbacteria)]|nr:radical SAM protein [Candidatus Stahlbacteria bacterium]